MLTQGPFHGIMGSFMHVHTYIQSYITRQITGARHLSNMFYQYLQVLLLSKRQLHMDEKEIFSVRQNIVQLNSEFEQLQAEIEGRYQNDGLPATSFGYLFSLLGQV